MNDLDNAVVGKLIRHHRDRMGLKQHQLAEMLGVDASYISKVETGQGLSLSAMVALSKALNFSLDELVPGRLNQRESRIYNACAHLTDAEVDIFMEVGMGAVQAYRKHNR